VDASRPGWDDHQALNLQKMKRIFIGLALGLGLAANAQPPQADISNGIIHARFYLPDSVNGYYRSTRFDWSGVMPSLEYAGHSYFGQWFPTYSPTLNDAIMGPVESFAPLGYAEAPAGGSFVEIGVGVLKRPDSAAYSPFRYYPIRDAGVWEVKRDNRQVRFRHTLAAYVYTKTVSLTKGKPQLVIVHRLRNTGSRPIETEVFDHNFFVTDSQTVASGIGLRFTFPLEAEQARGLGDLAAIRGDSISILRPFGTRESVYAVLHGYGNTAADYDIRLEDRITGAAVRIRADRPFSKLVYWGSVKTLCPEPYIHVSVAPGETFSWTLYYDFYLVNPHS
jgi:hypothetical protein